jgi:hypothetical protein
MGISEYENIEIFNKTQGFSINKCENQILSVYEKITGEVKYLILLPVCKDNRYFPSQIIK